MSHISTMTARDAKNRFGELIDAARQAPVHITKNGREVVVLLSREQYEVFETLEDLVWAKRAQEAEKEGYLGASESEKLIQSILHADTSSK